MNPVRRGGGITEPRPRTASQIIWFSSRSGARSGALKFMRSDAAAPGEFQSFFVSSGTRDGRTVYGASDGVVVNALYIGVAAASYWLIGGRPRTSSIVRSTPEVVYSVLSTTPRRLKGLTASRTERCASTWSG